MKVLSLFDGISCERVALERAGLHVDTYVAYEIDKFATKVSQDNYPDIIRCGNVIGADFSQYSGFDLVMGGFPCTDLSIAKKDRKGLKGEHSRLFWELVRAIKEVQPRYFLVENNASMPAADKAIITETLGVEAIMINSALVSAQNRKRLYWTNIPGVVQPEDKHIYLCDIVENGIGVKVADYGTRLTQVGVDKSGTIMGRDHKGLTQWACNGVLEPMIFQRARGKNKGGLKFDKSPTLTANSWQDNNHLVIGAALRTRDTPRGRIKKLEVNHTGKANALTTVQTDSMSCEPVRLGIKDGCRDTRSSRIYSVRGKSISLCANGGGGGALTGLYKIYLPDGDYIVRKLTPIECERLQTLPENYTKAVSNTQRYKGLGNGWTVDVITHILSYISKINAKKQIKHYDSIRINNQAAKV